MNIINCGKGVVSPIGTKVVEFCIKELSKKNYVLDAQRTQSARRHKDPAAWKPIEVLIWKHGEMNHRQITSMLGFKCYRTAIRNLKAMEEAGMLTSRLKPDSKTIRWYSLVQ